MAMKGNQIKGAEGIIIHNEKIVLGLQKTSRWYKLQNGKIAAAVKTIGGQIEEEDQDNSKKAIIREIFEEIKNIETTNIEIEDNIIFTKSIPIKDLNRYEEKNDLKMTADFYYIQILEKEEILPNDLPALIKIPIEDFLKIDLSNEIEMNKIENWIIKNDKCNIELPQYYTLMIPEEVKDFLKRKHKSKKSIAFDFDGVIADTTAEKIKWLQKKGINIDSVDKTSFYKFLETNMKKEEIDNLYKEMSKEIFTPQTLEKTKPIEDSIKVIRELSKKFDIYIITARTEELIKPVKAWLEKYNINKNIKEIISSSFEKKQDICLRKDICLLCDDDLRHVFEKNIETRILFNDKTLIENDKKLIITKSWKEIKRILLE